MKFSQSLNPTVPFNIFKKNLFKLGCIVLAEKEAICFFNTKFYQSIQISLTRKKGDNPVYSNRMNSLAVTRTYEIL